MVSTPTPLPVRYEDCRAGFRRAATAGGWRLDAIAIPGATPDGGDLTIDVAVLGSATPHRALLVLSGVHGVEGPAGSAMQRAFAATAPGLGSDDAIVLVHGVNPWGMAWWRRQNEHNVDLNRNWPTFAGSRANDAYAELHPLLCPPADADLDDDAFVRTLAELGERRGLPWLRLAISGGQYTHADGLYYGGTTPEPSTAALRTIVSTHLTGVDELLVVDLHTGHGARGAATILSPAPAGSADDAWVRRAFAGIEVEAAGAAEAVAAPKRGQLAVGVVDRLQPTAGRSVTFEVGTRSETRMIVAERSEHWVHQFGDRADPVHAEILRAHLECSIPPDAEWAETALDHGARVLDLAVTAVFDPRG